VLVPDAFMDAVRRDEAWPLVFPAQHVEGSGEIVERRWSGEGSPVHCRVLARIGAKELWRRIMRAAYESAEPGVLFVDRINRLNNLHYREHISATNPCGEIPLPNYGACDLGSINLTAFVVDPFARGARFDFDAFRDIAALAVRMLDDVVDVSGFPLPAQHEQARGTRRIGLGITGLADAMIMLGHRYGDDDSLAFSRDLMRALCHTAYRTSIDLASEKGAFPYFERDAYLDGEFVRMLPADIRDGIAATGIRNSHLVAIAPTGTISLLANNVSSGLEPVFDVDYTRRIVDESGEGREYGITDFACRLWRELKGRHVPLPETFVDARSLAPGVHLAVQAALAPYVDSAISKTVNVPPDLPFGEFETLYLDAFELGLKGCTTFRANPVTGEVLSSVTDTKHCCSIEREAD